MPQFETPTEFDFDARYRVEGWSGIAWHAWNYEIKQVPIECLVEDEFGNEFFCESGDYEEEENKERVVCTMVGDDAKHTFEIELLTKLEEDEFCPECGQIGCRAYG